MQFYNLVKNFFTADFAVTQLFAATLFAILALNVISFVKNYIPEKIDANFIVMAIIAAAVSGSFYYYFSTVTTYSQIFVNIAISLTLGFCIMHPAIALATLISYLIFRPWEMLENEDLAILPRSLLLLFIISLIINFFQKGRVKLDFSKPQLLVIALGGWVFLSTVFSGDAVNSQSWYFDTYIKSIIVAVFIFQTVKTEADYRIITNTIVAAVLGLSFFALINTYFILGLERLEGRGAVQNSNDLAAMLIFIVPLSLRSLLKGKILTIETLVSAVLIFILGLGVYKAQSRASYIAIVLMGMTFFFYHFRHQKKQLIRLSIVAVLLFGVLSQLSLGRDEADLDESKMNRLGFWKAGISMAIRHPLLGVGFTQFPNNYAMYGAAEFTESGKRTAHNSWILLVSEAGFPALTLMVVLFAQSAIRAWRLFPRAPELLLMVVGYGVCMTFLSHTYVLYPYILFSLVFTYPDQDDSAPKTIGASDENPMA